MASYQYIASVFGLGMVRLLQRGLLLPWFCDDCERPIVIPLWALMIGLTFGPIIYWFGLKHGEMFNFVAGFAFVFGLALTFLLGGYGLSEHDIEERFSEFNEVNPLTYPDKFI